MFRIPPCSLLLFAVSFAKIHAVETVFEFQDSTDRWGTWSAGTDRENYTGPFSDYTSTSVEPRNGVHPNEGVVDATGAIFNHLNSLGASTWISDGVDGSSSGLTTKLGSAGDSINFRFAYHFLAKYAPDDSISYAAANSMSLFEIGVTAGSDYFGSSADSFFISAVPSLLNPIYTNGDYSDVTGSYGLYAHTESSVGGSQAGQLINTASNIEVVNNLQLNSIGVSGGRSDTTHGDGIFHTYDLTFTNDGAGNFVVDYVIDQYIGDSLKAGSTASFDAQVASGSASYAHGLDEATLDDLMIGVGFRTLDSDVPLSGATFDNFMAASIPEPTTHLLIVGTLGCLAGYRRRKSC
ncbi:MAG: hypothetical protein Q7Q71_00510 [Verrucomicrobiota bacterium JB023]|nr:hypothetical protein [Verrucomicrobiota bacterium JB023]